MSLFELTAIMPQLVISFVIVLQLLLISIKRSTLLIQYFTVFGLISAFIAFGFTLPALNNQITTLFYLDAFSLGTLSLILISAISVVLISEKYLRFSQEVHDEYYVLLMLVVLGASVLVIADHFASVFLGLELLSIALIGLVGYLRKREQTLEASFKYLILSATASSVLLFGMAMVYAYTGNMNFSDIAISPLIDSLEASTASNKVSIGFAEAGFVLILIGIAFKLSLAPFHFWTPDVYQGAPAPVTMILATISKVSMFAVLVKFWFLSQQYFSTSLITVVTFIAIFSMLVGNLLALKQKNIKRLLAYSSIAHMGYLAIILVITSSQSIEFSKQTALFYLFAYTLSSIILFSYVCQTTKAYSKHDSDVWQNWQGVFWHSPWQSCALILALLSLAGIPLTAGFIAKFYVLTVAVANHGWWLLGALVIASGISLFYYLRVIFVMFDKPKGSQLRQKNDLITQSIMILLSLGLVAFGVYPSFISVLALP